MIMIVERYEFEVEHTCCVYGNVKDERNKSIKEWGRTH